MILYMVGKLDPNSPHFTRGLANMSPGGAIFVPSPPKTGTNLRHPRPPLSLNDSCSFLCVSGHRGTIAKSMHEEHLCVVALTSMERGTQFFPLASYRLV